MSAGAARSVPISSASVRPDGSRRKKTIKFESSTAIRIGGAARGGNEICEGEVRCQRTKIKKRLESAKQRERNPRIRAAPSPEWTVMRPDKTKAAKTATRKKNRAPINPEAIKDLRYFNLPVWTVLAIRRAIVGIAGSI